jgi:hypothetical protein
MVTHILICTWHQICHIKLQNEEADNGGFDRMYNELDITQANVTQELQNPGIPFTLLAGFLMHQEWGSKVYHERVESSTKT